MAKVEVLMPKMGESVAEATVINWLKNIGDTINAEESIIEIATDKVDSEIPSPSTGVLIEQKYQKDDVVKVGSIIAIIETSEEDAKEETNKETIDAVEVIEKEVNQVLEDTTKPSRSLSSTKNRFYSPLVKNIAQKTCFRQNIYIN